MREIVRIEEGQVQPTWIKRLRYFIYDDIRSPNKCPDVRAPAHQSLFSRSNCIGVDVSNKEFSKLIALLFSCIIRNERATIDDRACLDNARLTRTTI